ncbi:hypothetical protein [Frankia sp. Cr1]|uniref:hypothetical protein n=1 Tax=Frankia sp. Cr1 TaxID=3073931 RepID=UPI003A102D99
MADAAAVHGGQVRAEEGPGGGALLRLSLPVPRDVPSPSSSGAPSDVWPGATLEQEPDRVPHRWEETSSPASSPASSSTRPAYRRSWRARGSGRAL